MINVCPLFVPPIFYALKAQLYIFAVLYTEHHSYQLNNNTNAGKKIQLRIISPQVNDLRSFYYKLKLLRCFT